MKNNNMTRNLGEGNITKLLASLAIPAVVAQVVNLLYNIVDRVYIGHIPGIGANALTGVGLFTPILMLINAFAMLAGSGGAPRAAIFMGKKDNDTAERIIGNCFTFIMICAVVLTAVFYVSAPQLLRWFGASDATLPYALSYARIYILGSVFVLIVMAMNMFITTQGFAKISMLTTVIGAVINIVLDLWFVAGLNMGVPGVALATVIAQMISAVLCFLKLRKMKHLFDLKACYLKPHRENIATVVRLGVPSGITQAIFSLAMVVVQSLTNSFGEMVIAANVIIMRVDGFAMMPNFSFGTAMTTYSGQNVGAKKLDRVKEGAKQGTLIAVGTSAAITGVILLFGRHLMAIFTSTSELVTLSNNMMRVLALGYLAMAVTQSLSGVMRGAGDTMTPMWISLITTVAIRVPLAYGIAWMTRTPEMPGGWYACIWISLLVSWVLGAVITAVFYRWGKWKEKALE